MSEKVLPTLWARGGDDERPRVCGRGTQSVVEMKTLVQVEQLSTRKCHRVGRARDATRAREGVSAFVVILRISVAGVKVFFPHNGKSISYF